MALTAGENEMYVCQMLDVGTQECLYLPVFVVGHLLKLIECHIASLVGLFHIGKHLCQ